LEAGKVSNPEEILGIAHSMACSELEALLRKLGAKELASIVERSER
jgi:hypothetical protein